MGVCLFVLGFCFVLVFWCCLGFLLQGGRGGWGEMRLPSRSFLPHTIQSPHSTQTGILLSELLSRIT